MAKTEVTNIAVGKNKGHPTTKIQLKKRPAHAKYILVFGYMDTLLWVVVVTPNLLHVNHVEDSET